MFLLINILIKQLKSSKLKLKKKKSFVNLEKYVKDIHLGG